MIALYLKDSPQKLSNILSSLGVSFSTIGNVFILDMEKHAFFLIVEDLPKEITKKLKISFVEKEDLSSAEKLIEIGFRSISLEEFAEENLFYGLSEVLNNGDIYFHSIIDVKTKKIYGFEALCRLPIPIYKLFKVSDRIAFFADNFCRERALLDYTRRFPMQNYHLFLNFHPKFLKNPLENVGELITSLMNKEVDASKIVVEIDEYEGMDLKSVKLIRDFLKAEGIQVALDDVGTGYAGLYQLTEIHPDIAKLDMALVRDVYKSPVKQAVVKGLISACKASNIKVLAEGIEKEEELLFLLEAGVDLLQGFLFSKPSTYPNTREIEKVAYNLLAKHPLGGLL